MLVLVVCLEFLSTVSARCLAVRLSIGRFAANVVVLTTHSVVACTALVTASSALILDLMGG